MKRDRTRRLLLRSPQLLDEVMCSRGVTNRALVRDAAVSLGTVAGLRSGLRSGCVAPAARRICGVLGVDLALLFREDDRREAA